MTPDKAGFASKSLLKFYFDVYELFTVHRSSNLVLEAFDAISAFAEKNVCFEEATRYFCSYKNNKFFDV